MAANNLSKLSCKVVSFSSEDEDYPASQLNTISPNTRGWQCARLAAYPQELGFELIDGEAQICQLQLLSHQSKISSKIEMFIGRGSSYKTATFVRLGYMSLDSNERSSFQARELKTIYIDNMLGSFVKLIISENHINKQNIYSQVGIIAVSLLGTTEDSMGAPKASRYGPGHKVAAANNYNDLSVDLNLDPQTAGKLRQLAEAKSRAVDAEDYLTAKQIKLVEHDLKAMGSRLAQMDMAKADAVAAEDYDLAKDIKDETDALRREIEDKIMNINIPGVSLARAPAKVQKPKFAPESEEKSGYLSVRRVPDSAPFDDPPHFGAYNSPTIDSKIASGKKIAKVETVHHAAYDDRIGHDDHDEDQYADAKFEDERDEVDDSHLPYTERVIKPKSNVYEAALGGIDDDPNMYQAGAAPPKALEQFPEGQHPLEGVPGCTTTPTPEALGKASREMADQYNIVSLLGEYRVRCLYSKTWVLREAATKKTQIMLVTEFMRSPGLSSALTALCGIVKATTDDKIQQVMIAGISLLDELLMKLKESDISRNAALPMLDPIIAQLVEKLADGNGRLRDAARKGLEYMAAAPHVGPGAVASHCARSLPPKQKTAWRPIAARIQLLTDLVVSYGLGGNTGLTADLVLGFSKNHQAYAHSAAEVRDEAKKLVVAVQKLAGTPAVESTLKLLRNKQLEEYQAAFEAASGDHPTPMPGVASSKQGNGSRMPGGSGAKDSPASPARVDKHLQHATHAPGGKVPTSASKSGNPRMSQDSKPTTHNDQNGGEEAQDFTTCMFCQMHDKHWNENDLDVHYWKDCPLLISCPSCAQIVEIAGLPEHLLDECDEKDEYVPCEVTGLAIRGNEFEEWKRGPNCTPAPQNCLYCPLCLASVEDSDPAWLAHLMRGCPRNTRTNGSS